MKLFFLSIIFAAASLSAAAGNDTNKSKRVLNLQLEITSLQKQLTDLEEKVHSIRLKEMNEEITSQPLMIEQEWSEYTDKLKMAETYEEEAEGLEKEVNKLKKRIGQISEEINKQQTK